uniref:Calcium-binding and coiled-coil domain-containing protein 2 n=2 Tax=Corvus moneduloides TaxID=1196302 RepID=A0A8C3GUC3_CORMO
MRKTGKKKEKAQESSGRGWTVSAGEHRDRPVTGAGSGAAQGGAGFVSLRITSISQLWNSSMEDSPEEPPTSCVLLERCHFSQVLFTNVEKFYVPGTDVTCHYSLSPGIVPRGKDWVGIFQVGWKTTREYFTFLWAPVPAAGTTEQQIHFKAYYLPKDDEHYQFCYVDQDGAVRGASVPFQFRPEADDDILVVTTQGEVEEVELQNQKLRGENEELRGSCAELRQRNLQLQGELRSARELQEALESLRSSTERLELELNSLKSENRALKEQGGCREAELQRLKEQIQGLNSDKERLEGRLRAALEHLDQLQSKVSDYEKEVENLSRAEQDKTKQLQSLKGENQELLQTSAQHQKQTQDVLEQLREQQGRIQALQEEKAGAKKENQDLQDENEVLRRELSRLQRISPGSAPSAAPSPAPAEGELLFGNPYSAAGGKLGAGAEPSLRKCPICEEVFPEDFPMGDLEEHIQSHLLECPICSESFDGASPQVFRDHIFCHSLE